MPMWTVGSLVKFAIEEADVKPIIQRTPAKVVMICGIWMTVIMLKGRLFQEFLSIKYSARLIKPRLASMSGDRLTTSQMAAMVEGDVKWLLMEASWAEAPMMLMRQNRER